MGWCSHCMRAGTTKFCGECGQQMASDEPPNTSGPRPASETNGTQGWREALAAGYSWGLRDWIAIGVVFIVAWAGASVYSRVTGRDQPATSAAVEGPATDATSPGSLPNTTMTVDGVYVDASDGFMCVFLATINGKNQSGAPVTVRVDVGAYEGSTLIEFNTGEWDMPTGFDGALSGLEWPYSLDQMAQEKDLTCRLREVEVTPRG
jgi:hypothetical protein